MTNYYWAVLPLRRYFDFSGRSRRREYWLFTLLNVAVAVVAGALDVLLLGNRWSDNGPVAAITSIALIIPSIAVSFRRLHDIDRSAWWMLLAFLPIVGWIVLIVWACRDGQGGANKFGGDPKNPESDLHAIFS